MKKSLLLTVLLACLSSLQAFAYDFKSNGVCYNITEGLECQVTANPDKYQDAIYVPAAVSVDDVMYKVTGIEARAFKDCQGLKTIMIADGVKTIGTKAFSGCTNLSSVTLPSDLTTLSYGLFDECYSLSSIIIPQNLKIIEGCAFFECNGLKEITLPNSVDSIGEYIFAGCSKLTSILVGPNPAKATSLSFAEFNIKRSYLYVPYGAQPKYKEAEFWSEFSNIYESGKDIIDMYIQPNTITLNEGETTNLSLVVTPTEAAGVTVTWTTSNPLVATVNGMGQVSAKTAGEAIITAKSADVSARTATCTITVNQSSTQTVIAYTTGSSEPLNITRPYAFKNAEGTSVNIASNSYDDGLGLIVFDGIVSTLGDSAFYGTESLTSISVPVGVTTIGERTFQNCVYLKQVNLPSSLLSFGKKAFSNCESLSYISIPASVSIISWGAFNECYGLKNIELAHGLTKIDDYAFFECKALKSVDIPSTVTVIDEYAFNGCNALTSVRVGKTPATITSTSFNSNKSKISLEVPYGCTAAYQAADYWKEFTKILEYGEVEVSAVKISKDYMSLVEGETAKLSATIEPAELSSLSITWSTTNSKVATVDGNGLVTAISAGSVYIIASATDYAQTSDSCMLVVTRKPILASGISLNKNSLTITEGETATLIATIAPVDASNQDVTWESSDNSIATVVDGVVSAIKPGNATITATTADGTNLSDACEVTVKAKEVKVTEITLSNTELTLKQGEFYTLSVTIVPENATNQAVSWQSSDITVAMVSDGTIAALGIGTATITATAADNSGTFADCVVTVEEGSSISQISADGTICEYYQLDGIRISQLKKGINVVHKTDGSVVKVYVK